MSLINTMLQDLDRRQGLGANTPVSAVRAPAGKPRREWFWHVLAVLMVLSLAWVGWVAYHVMPRPIITKLGSRAGEEARLRAPVVSEPLAPPAVPAEPIAAPEPAAAAEPVRAAAMFETLRLATELRTAVREVSAAPPARREPAAAPRPKSAAKATVDKFDRSPAGSMATTGEFRRAVMLVNQGRVAEAQQLLAGVLKSAPAHAPARQVYVALLLEHGRLEEAQRLLQDGLKLAPTHTEFALALARIHTSQREYEVALEVLDRAASNGSAPSAFHAMRGAALQRIGRHAEAVQSYQTAVSGAPQQATSWLGLALSLEALGRVPEAGEAYRRALSAGPLAREARDYAETRIRALE